jgi:hypothetical protein
LGFQCRRVLLPPSSLTLLPYPMFRPAYKPSFTRLATMRPKFVMFPIPPRICETDMAW